MKILLLDNYDSFTFNLYQALAALGHEVRVAKNDELSLEKVRSFSFDRIVISPGPGTPEKEEDIGVCMEVIQNLGQNIPILGVCLGHQCIVHAFGGKIVMARQARHGKKSLVRHNGKGIFSGVKNPFEGMRYHSLVGKKENLPSCLKITASSLDDHAIMAVQHRSLPIFGVQFHPESLFTQQGKKILENFCRQEGMK